MARFKLAYHHPAMGEQKFALEEERTYRLGARGDNDIVIPQQDVSRHHAVITVTSGKLLLTDLDSKNGTFVNGQLVSSCELRGGDQLGLSSATLVILESGVDSGAEPPSGESQALTPPDTPPDSTDTTQFRLGATSEDLLELLDVTAAAVVDGGGDGPLRWALDRLGVEAALVVYRDRDGKVAIVASQGALEGLVKSHADLVRLAAERVGGGPEKAGLVSQEEVSGSQIVVTRLACDHLLILRCPGNPLSVSDLRALVAAENAVLAAARAAGRGARPGTALEALMERPFVEARGEFERMRVERALAVTGWRWTEAAVQLGLTRAGLFKVARRLGLKG